jgi:hypothetical protein
MFSCPAAKFNSRSVTPEEDAGSGTAGPPLVAGMVSMLIAGR